MTEGVFDEVWIIFDLVKVNLTDLLVKGVETGGTSAIIQSLATLREKLAAMNMSVIVGLLDALTRELLDQGAGARGIEKRSRISGIMMRIMTAARLFESQMNLETVKQQLLGG
jgi:hypothetical protein